MNPVSTTAPTFTSRFAHEDHVWVRRSDRPQDAISGRVISVTFTHYGKVQYDVELDSDGSTPSDVATRVDSDFVEPCDSAFFPAAAKSAAVAPINPYRSH